MDVVLVHDPSAPPFDVWDALTAAGHRVASHGTHAASLLAFLDVMTWAPQAIVVDHRGDPRGAARALAALAGHPRWGRARLLAAWPPDADDVPGGVPVARGVDAVLAALPD